MELISTEYIYLSASVIAFRKQYDQLLVILGLSRYQTTGRFPGWKILIQILPSQCICISDKSSNLYSLITVTRSYRNCTCFPFNRSTFSITQQHPEHVFICFENGRHQLSFSMKLYLSYHIRKTDTTLFICNPITESLQKGSPLPATIPVPFPDR